MGKVGLVFGLLAVLLAQKRPLKKNPSSGPARDTAGWRAAAPPFVRAVGLFTQGLYEESAEYFSRAAELAPNSPAIHHYLARLAYHQGDYIRMLTHAEKAYREDPNSLWVALGYVAALELNNQAAQALTVLDRLSQAFPTESEVAWRLAEAYRRLGKWEKADAWYRRLQHLGGSYEEVIRARVQMWIEAGELGRALAIVDSALAVWPSHEVYWELQARLHELGRNFPALIRTVQRLLDLDPANSTAWAIVLAYPELFEETWGDEGWERYLNSYLVPAEVKYALLRQVDFLEEEDYYATLRTLLQQAPTAEGWNLYARYWSARGAWDSAAWGWKQALLEDSLKLSGYAPYLYALWRLGGGDSLAREVERALDAYPGQGFLLLWQGVSLAQRKAWKEALGAFRRGWPLLPKPADTALMQVALYYQACAEAASGALAASTAEQLEKLFHPSVGKALLTVMSLRHGLPEGVVNAPLPSEVPSPYREWIHMWVALRAQRPEEARRAASVADTAAVLPLEMWEDIFTRLGPSLLGAAYHRWRARAEKQYPLASLWRSLP
ncbi:MAG: hypothetical protein KatS3mg026_1824 [Bacteroidia bacterium]|nr:MAG: hypothetical protein KatS3mg026_1824 [Bacteroidia bacterium]